MKIGGGPVVSLTGSKCSPLGKPEKCLEWGNPASGETASPGLLLPGRIL